MLNEMIFFFFSRGYVESPPGSPPECVSLVMFEYIKLRTTSGNLCGPLKELQAAPNVPSQEIIKIFPMYHGSFFFFF